MESATQLRERRAFECRLTPDRALRSLDEAGAFLRDRGMLTRTTDSALPSLYEACHEEPYKASGVGFAAWPATKWSWFGELTVRGHLCVAVHRGKNLLVSSETATVLDPICRAETDRMRAAGPGWRALGSGTGPGPSWTTWSGPAASAAWTAMSRPASRSDRGRVHEAGMVLRREYHPGLPLREQHPLAARQRERGPAAQFRP